MEKKKYFLEWKQGSKPQIVSPPEEIVKRLERRKEKLEKIVDKLKAEEAGWWRRKHDAETARVFPCESKGRIERAQKYKDKKLVKFEITGRGMEWYYYPRKHRAEESFCLLMDYKACRYLLSQLLRTEKHFGGRKRAH